jgi:hypothetical protein
MYRSASGFFISSFAISKTPNGWWSEALGFEQISLPPIPSPAACFLTFSWWTIVALWRLSINAGANWEGERPSKRNFVVGAVDV